MTVEKWTILSPVAPPPVIIQQGPFRLDRPLDGVTVGLQIDFPWTSFPTVIDEWSVLLRADGAEPVTLWTDDATPPEAEEWARLIDCGVVGLGN